MNLRKFLIQFATLYLLFVGVYCGRRSRYKQFATNIQKRSTVIINNLKTRIINIAVLLPGNNDLDYSLAKALPAIELAVSAVNEQNTKQSLINIKKLSESAKTFINSSASGVYNNWSLRINAMDTNCSSITGPLAAFELYSDKKAGTDIYLFIFIINL